MIIAMALAGLVMGLLACEFRGPASARAPHASTAADDRGRWVELFNGRNLDGWIQRGGKAEYRAEGGAIVGRSVPRTPNSFLCTVKTFGDFLLEMEFKVDAEMNSGIQFRSECLEQPRIVEHGDKKFDIAAGRVHGYQYEIDPSARKWTAGVYDEGRRGWLVNLDGKKQAQEAFKQGAWNRARIECRGDRIRTWINGVQAADLADGLTRTGFIALQVHGVGDRPEPLEVRWRAIRLKPL